MISGFLSERALWLWTYGSDPRDQLSKNSKIWVSKHWVIRNAMWAKDYEEVFLDPWKQTGECNSFGPLPREAGMLGLHRDAEKPGMRSKELRRCEPRTWEEKEAGIQNANLQEHDQENTLSGVSYKICRYIQLSEKGYKFVPKRFLLAHICYIY